MTVLRLLILSVLLLLQAKADSLYDYAERELLNRNREL